MIFLGIDVSKKKLDAKVLIDPVRVKFKSKSVPNTPPGVAELLAWTMRRTGGTIGEIHAVMEATGVYHERAATALFDAGVRVSVVNPAHLRDFARGLAVKSKNDGLDSAVLARYGALVNPGPWQPEPLAVRELKALLSRLDAIETDLRRELNRREKTEHAAVPQDVVDSLDHSIAFLREEQARLTERIRHHIDRHPPLRKDRALLESIPAVGDKTAFRMLALLRSRTFTSAAQAAAFVGLVPVEHQSGSSVCQRPRLSKTGNARVRAALYMAAVVATRHNPDIRVQYERLLAAGKPKMSALGAAMRKLVHICFGVLKHQTPYVAQCVL